jgi:hypothetical protein
MKKAVTWAVVALVALTVGLAFTRFGARAEFLLGGAMVNVGYRLQDHLEAYDFEHHESTPTQIWAEFLDQNHLASKVRETWPRSARHPVIAMVACMDGRLDTNEIAGDTRHYYYILRLAGSVLSPREEEMLELAVSNGVKVVIFTTHSDCAAEKVAKDPAKRVQFPELSKAVDERAQRFNEFIARPLIAERLSKGELIVKWLDLETNTERVSPHAAN